MKLVSELILNGLKFHFLWRKSNIIFKRHLVVSTNILVKLLHYLFILKHLNYTVVVMQLLNKFNVLYTSLKVVCPLCCYALYNI